MLTPRQTQEFLNNLALEFNKLELEVESLRKQIKALEASNNKPVKKSK